MTFTFVDPSNPTVAYCSRQKMIEEVRRLRASGMNGHPATTNGGFRVRAFLYAAPMGGLFVLAKSPGTTKKQLNQMMAVAQEIIASS
jgi:hypothetical protein